MKFSQEDPTDALRIQSYDTESIVIQSGYQSDSTTMTEDFILNAKQIVSPWPINAVADFTTVDIDYFKSLDIEVLLLAQTVVTRLSPTILVQFSQQAIGVEQMPIGSACRTYNLLIAEGRQVALAVSFN
tara:strand:- start:1539 stop:1925 length:387 start_codon:yes stop_codon:yes gene_type:complete